MQKDVTQKRLENCNDVFSDIFNCAVFGGKEILKEDELISLPTESFTRNQDGSVRQGFRDIRKADGTYGQYRLICGIENQSGVDNTMPQRIAGYEYASYEEQIKEIVEKNKKEGQPAYAKRIHDGQKLVPVVTAVLHWGSEAWTGPKCLHDMLAFPKDIVNDIRPYVADYPINLIQVAHLPEEVFDALAALTGDTRYQEMKDRMAEDEEKEDMKMCVVAEKLEKIGIEKGIEMGTQKVICNMLRRGMPEEEICELAECTQEFLEEVKKGLYPG